MEERERMSGSGGRDGRWTGCGRAVDGLWTGGSCRNSMGGGYKVELPIFRKKKDSTFGLFWLWEETGYVWDVVAGVLL